MKQTAFEGIEYDGMLIIERVKPNLVSNTIGSDS